MNSGEKFRELLKIAKNYAEKDRLQQAAEKLQEARQIATKTKSERKQVQTQTNEIFGKLRYNTETQTIKMKTIDADGFILDIGGGGEGIIGKLNGKQVIAIDTSEEELKETDNDSLKIIMDPTDLKFLAKSFDACTAFFSLMYIPRKKHLEVFKQAHRVLKDEGRFLLWDVEIPERNKDFRAFALRVKIKMPNQEIETGYGTVWDKTQDIQYFRQLALHTGFRVIKDWSRDSIFHLEMKKEKAD